MLVGQFGFGTGNGTCSRALPNKRTKPSGLESSRLQGSCMVISNSPARFREEFCRSGGVPQPGRDARLGNSVQRWTMAASIVLDRGFGSNQTQTLSTSRPRAFLRSGRARFRVQKPTSSAGQNLRKLENRCQKISSGQLAGIIAARCPLIPSRLNTLRKCVIYAQTMSCCHLRDRQAT